MSVNPEDFENSEFRHWKHENQTFFSKQHLKPDIEQKM